MENNELTTAQELNNDTKRNCQDVVLGIMQLAMMNQSLVDINVDYVPSNNLICVHATNKGDYETYNYENVPYLISETVYFNDEFEILQGKTLENLLALEDKVIAIIAEAKDNAEVAA